MSKKPMTDDEARGQAMDAHFGGSYTGEQMRAYFAGWDAAVERERGKQETPVPLDLDMLEACAKTIGDLREFGPTESLQRRVWLLGDWALARRRDRLRAATTSDSEPECTCYEVIGGHQSMCPRAKR